MNTPLEELIEKEAEKYADSQDRRGTGVWQGMYRGYIEGMSRTEEIAIGFSKWKFNTNWILVGVSESGELMYGNCIVEQPRKTDSELFKDYMESLKP